MGVDNLHRQIAYREQDCDKKKAETLANTVKSLNSTVQTVVHLTFLEPQNAVEIVENYDLVLDCSDNVGTRYLVNDACVLAGKPLVSASALRWEGQLTVYDSRRDNDGRRTGPCYRCLFPEPPPAAAVGSCSANGVVGPVVGTMGTLQSLEAIKFLSGNKTECLIGRMLLFHGLSATFRNIGLRKAQDKCPVCGVNPQIRSLVDDSNDLTRIYRNEVQCVAPLKLIEKNSRLSPKEYLEIKDDEKLAIVTIDVRPRHHFDVCHIENSMSKIFWLSFVIHLLTF